jgi:hypothetical protein
MLSTLDRLAHWAQRGKTFKSVYAQTLVQSPLEQLETTHFMSVR